MAPSVGKPCFIYTCYWPKGAPESQRMESSAAIDAPNIEEAEAKAREDCKKGFAGLEHVFLGIEPATRLPSGLFARALSESSHAHA